MKFDGAKCKNRSRAGIIFQSLSKPSKRFSRITWSYMNNATEYESLCLGLSKSIILGIKCLLIIGYSKLIINQVTYKCFIKHHYMKAYKNRVKNLSKDFLALNHSSKIMSQYLGRPVGI